MYSPFSYTILPGSSGSYSMDVVSKMEGEYAIGLYAQWLILTVSILSSSFDPACTIASVIPGVIPKPGTIIFPISLKPSLY